MGQHNIERDRKTFRDLAQLASQPSLQRGSISEIRSSQRDVTGAAKGGDSGLIDFGMLGQPEPGSVDRASVTPLASTDLADAEDLPTAPKISVTPPPLPASVRALQPPISAAIHTPLAISSSVDRAALRADAPSSQRAPHAAQIMSAQAALLAADPEPSRGAMGRVVALLGIAAVAAGAFLVVRTLRAPNTQGEHIVVSTAAAAAPHAPLVAPAPTPTPAADRGIDPMSLPQAGALNAQPVVIATGGHHVHHHHGLAKSGAPATASDDSDDSDDSSTAAPVAAAAPKPDATPAAAPATKPPPTPAWLQGALGEAITKAASPATTPAPAADPGPAAAPIPVPASAPVAAGSVPQHPSQGAVTSALSGALPSARACLGPDDDVSRVRVVFGSDGAVQSMTVTGFAAGKPQEACIKGALGKAHVPPFAEATYGANVNVRP